MAKKSQIVLAVLGITLLYIVYRVVFSSDLLISTDLPYLPHLNMSLQSLVPKAWDAQRNAGMGGIYTPFLWYFFVVNLPSILLANIFHFPWEITQRLVLFFPFFICGSISTYAYIFSKTRTVRSGLLGILIFFLNSYVLMLFSGGQMQILIAASLIPSLLLLLELYIKQKRFSQRLYLLLFVGVYSLVGMYDIRIAYLAALIISIRSAMFLVIDRRLFIRLLILGISTVSCFLLFHFFWLLPTVLHKSNPIDDLGSAFNSVASVKFFSFAGYEYPFALLHPLWPKNIFGQVAFFQPTFLLIPLLAFVPMLFSKDQQTKQDIIFSVLLITVGAFFAKGATEPFGNVYVWFFTHVPGFELFRDSTKFYVLVVMGYVLLIPIGYEILITKFRIFQKRYDLLFVGVLLIFISPVVPGIWTGLPGVFVQRSYPEEYSAVTRLLDQDAAFSRVLWYPQITPFAYISSNHPGISASEYTKESQYEKLASYIHDSSTEKILFEDSVKYIILPSDVGRSMYITDRKYDRGVYIRIKKTLDALPYAKQIFEKNDLIVYRISNYRPHISLTSYQNVSFRQDAFWQYTVQLTNHDIRDEIIFSEAYDPGWVAINQETKRSISARKTNAGTMAFPVSGQNGDEYRLFYTPEVAVLWGSVVSLLSFFVYLGIIGRDVYIWRKK